MFFVTLWQNFHELFMFTFTGVFPMFSRICQKQNCTAEISRHCRGQFWESGILDIDLQSGEQIVHAYFHTATPLIYAIFCDDLCEAHVLANA